MIAVSGTTDNDPSYCSKIKSEPTLASSATVSVLDHVESLKNFLSTHPHSRYVFNSDVAIKEELRRRKVVRVSVEKLVEERGLYPRKLDKVRLSVVLGQLFNQPASVFYDEATSLGFITYSLQAIRKNIPPSIRNQLGLSIETTDVNSQFG